MKHFCRALITITAFVLVYAICSRILLLKSEDGIEQMQSFYLQKENTVDVLLLGSSHIYCNVNTGILWDEYGISAFDLGGAEEPYWNGYYYLKEALKTQRPKLIVMDVSIPGTRSVDYQPEVWTVTNLYGMKYNNNRLEATRVSTLKQSFLRLLNPMNTMHTRYDQLTMDDFVDENRSVNYKGFDYRDRVEPFENRDMSDVTELIPLQEKEEKYFRQIIALTKEYEIPLLLVCVPFPIYTYEDAQGINNYQFMIAKEEGIPYIDFNRDHYYEKIGLNMETDMADEFHMNIDGNRKFTTYFGKYLSENYSLTDHRGDPAYRSWEEDAATHRQEVCEAQLKKSQGTDDYLPELQNEYYISYVALGGQAQTSFAEENRDALSLLGIGKEQCISGNIVITNGGECLYASASDDQRTLCDLGDRRLLLVREDGQTKLFANDKEYSLDTDGIKILVFDKQLKRVVSEREF